MKRYHFTPTRMVKIKKTSARAGEKEEHTDTRQRLSGYKMVPPLQKTVFSFLKLKYKSPMQKNSK